MQTSLSLTNVQELEDRVTGVMGEARTDAADAFVARVVAEVKQQFSRDGTMLLTNDILAGVERQQREKYDRDLLGKFEAVEKDREALGQQLAAFAEASGELPSSAQQWGVGTANFLAARQL